MIINHQIKHQSTYHRITIEDSDRTTANMFLDRSARFSLNIWLNELNAVGITAERRNQSIQVRVADPTTGKNTIIDIPVF